MKYYKQILEAINRGIQFALDDVEPEDMLDVKAKSRELNREDSLIIAIELKNQYVDLDLPSGTLWCKHNVGAIRDNGEFNERWYGSLFSWGELEEKESYYDVSYKFYNSKTDWSKYKEGEDAFKYSVYNVITKLTKYCTNPHQGLNGFTDNIIQLQPEDDIVSVQAKSDRFKIPTEGDFNELLRNTNAEWDSENHGYKFISKKDPSKYIFLPMAGYKRDLVGTWFDNGKRHCEGSNAYYWTSTLNKQNPNNAMVLKIKSDIISKPVIESSSRWAGFSIRGIFR